MTNTQSLAASGRGDLRSWPLGDLLVADFPVREPLLNGLLREGESMMLWAATGVGKTMAALSMALAIAGGGTFLAWKASTPRRVLYVDGEMHLGDLRDRLAVLMTAVDGVDQEAASRNLVILARQAQSADADFPDLATPDGQKAVYDRVRGGRFDLVILDNFSVLASVDDENDASAMTPVLSFLLRLKQAGNAAILVHHSGKGGTDYRGSSKLATTFEVIAGLTAAKGVESRWDSSFDITFGKYRARRGETIEGTTAWLQEDNAGTLGWKFKLSEDGQLKKLVDAVRSGRFCRQKDVAEALGWSPVRIPTKPAMHSNWKPATCSDLKPAGIPI